MLLSTWRRKRALLLFLHSTKQRLLRLLIVAKWTNKVPGLHSCPCSSIQSTSTTCGMRSMSKHARSALHAWSLEGLTTVREHMPVHERKGHCTAAERSEWGK